MSISETERSRLISLASENGADNAALAKVAGLEFNKEFRQICEGNACGLYGNCWMCPPFVGEIEQLIKEVKTYSDVLVYQTISRIEDSFDIEGMTDAGMRHNRIAGQIAQAVMPSFSTKQILHLAAGGCRVCSVCAQKENEPCRFPDRALSSLEAYGISVLNLAQSCGLSYNNGPNTITFFGAFFIR